MTHPGKVCLPLVLVVLAGCSEPRHFAEYDALPEQQLSPSTLLDLSYWTLTLPVDRFGGTTAAAATIDTAALLGGYQSEWFHVSQDGGGVTFWAPVTGARTERSSFARSELREMLDPFDPSVNRTIHETAELSATLVVQQAPLANGKVVIGQILGYNGEDPSISDLLKLVYQYDAVADRAQLYAIVADAPWSGAPSRQLVLREDELRLHEGFSYSIRIEDGVLQLRSGTSVASSAIDPSWEGVGVYFRAGALPMATGTDSSDGARVTFYSLGVGHGEASSP